MDNKENRKWPSFLVYLAGITGVFYLLNPTLGIFELIPDTIPVVGNLDEGAAAILAWNAIQQIRSLRKSK